jgi:hypothetical protein
MTSIEQSLEMGLEKSLEFYLRKQYKAFNDADVHAIDEGWGVGYGYRSLMPRAEIPPAMHVQFTQMFFDMMERYEMTIDELHVKVDGNIGLAWGFHSEDFQVKNQAPEKVKVRFSMTLKQDDRHGWRVLMGHRDIQTFENGMYIAQPV